MNCLLAAALVATLLGCTKSNPRSCVDGSCTDPSCPFCDVDGALEGTEKVCIAVECTPGEFRACRDDSAITCNEVGGDYDLVRCEKGCDESSGGCRLCEPNQTACTNGRVATCDASGSVTASETCALGCFEDQPRCREIVPANNLGAYLDMVASPPALDLMNATFDTSTGAVMAGTQSVDVPSFFVNASGNGVPIRVFIVKSLKLQSASMVASGGQADVPEPAFALISRGDIDISGEIVVANRVGAAVAGCAAAGSGSAVDHGNGRVSTAGGGGGGNATAGGRGGGVFNTLQGGIAGAPSGNPTLVPLRGGCSGGYIFIAPPNGGGAVQFTSRTSINLDATIDVRGAGGEGDRFNTTNGYTIGGAGAGGSVLLEAPKVSMGQFAKLRASGGLGMSVCTTAGPYCGIAGVGATEMTPATAGGDTDFTNTANTIITAGGGGGGLGRIRVNTQDGVYSRANSTVEDGDVSSAKITTR